MPDYPEILFPPNFLFSKRRHYYDDRNKYYSDDPEKGMCVFFTSGESAQVPVDCDVRPICRSIALVGVVVGDIAECFVGGSQTGMAGQVGSCCYC